MFRRHYSSVKVQIQFKTDLTRFRTSQDDYQISLVSNQVQRTSKLKSTTPRRLPTLLTGLLNAFAGQQVRCTLED